MILRFTRDNNGGVLVEATIMITIMFVFVLGSIDFLFAFYQWNAATKAVQMGVELPRFLTRREGVSTVSAQCVSASLRPGSAMPSFTVTCDGGTATCTCQGACKGVGGYNDAADADHCVWTRQHGLWRCDLVLHRRNVRHL
jgi:Flp pilus assembly protein TadG